MRSRFWIPLAVPALVVLAILAAFARPAAPPAKAATPWPVYLSDRAAHRLAVRPGDVLEVAVQPAGPWQAVRVAGVYRPRRYPSEVARTSVDLRLHLPDLQRLLGIGDEADTIVLRLRRPRDAAAVASRLNAAALGFRAYTSADLAERNSGTFEVIRRFHRAIGMVTILAGSVFLLAIMTLKGEEMRREVGALRLIGLSSRTVSAAMLGIATAVSLLGTAAGVVLSYLLSFAINAYYRRVFDTDLVFSQITPGLLALAGGLGVALGIAAGAVTAWRLLRQAPLAQVGR
jgi:putative ABC transport system permease protein